MSSLSKKTIQMEVQQAWLNNNTLYFPKSIAEFFPSDCYGARGKSDLPHLPAKGVPVTLVYAGSSVETDIAKEVASGRLRPRDRGSLRRFYSVTDAAAGDFVVVTRVGERTFAIDLVKADGAAI